MAMLNLVPMNGCVGSAIVKHLYLKLKKVIKNERMQSIQMDSIYWFWFILNIICIKQNTL